MMPTGWKLAALVAVLSVGMMNLSCRKQEPAAEEEAAAPAPPPPKPRKLPMPPQSKPASAPATATAPAVVFKVRPAPTLDESYNFFVRISAPMPIYRVPVVDQAPDIDGAMDECYNKSAAMTFRHLTGKPGVPKGQTTCHLVSTDKELFIFMQCSSPEMDAVKATVTKKNGPVWQDDSVEIFLDPFNRRRMDSYMQLVINPLGTTMTAKGPKAKTDTAWDPRLRVKTARDAKAWSVEVAIPFEDIVGNSSLTRAWAANFNRLAHFQENAQEDTAWCPTGVEDSHVPTHFGCLWLDAGTVHADYSAWGGPRHVYAPPENPIFKWAPIDPNTINKCDNITPNADETAAFGRRPLENNSESLVIVSDGKAWQVTSIHGWRPMAAQWLNNKLLYISRAASASEGYYCLFDLERQKVILEETEVDGADVWERLQDKLKKNPPPAEAATKPASASAPQ